MAALAPPTARRLIAAERKIIERWLGKDIFIRNSLESHGRENRSRITRDGATLLVQVDFKSRAETPPETAAGRTQLLRGRLGADAAKDLVGVRTGLARIAAHACRCLGETD